MKVIFVGSIILSEKTLIHTLKNSKYICGVISLKEKTDKFKSDYSDISKIAIKYSINSISVKSINSQKSINWINKMNPDLIICMGWSEILSKKIISIPKKGVVGYHPSDLPHNKGKHPIIWSLALGLNKSASAFFLIDEKIDSGPIISKIIFNIHNKDDATSIYNKLINYSKKQILEILKKFEKNQIKLKIQKKVQSNFLRKRTFKDGQINWSSNAQTIYNLVRSLTFPYPNAHFVYNKRIYKVTKCQIGKFKKKNIEYGKVVNIKKNKYFEVKCGVASLKIYSTKPKIKLKVGDYL